MKFTFAVVPILSALALAALGETGVSLTIYNENLALVRDVRNMTFKSGRDQLSFRDVSAQIDATSVHFGAAGVNMLEQNFDYDLVSPEKLLQKYVDQKIDVVNEKGDVISGTLLTSAESRGGSSQIVLQQEDKSLRSVLMSNVADIRYPSLPEGLITRPTLRWLVDAQSGGEKETEVSYLTGGMSWNADYVAVLNGENTRADLDAWVTIKNTCGASFNDASLKLMAGEPNRVRDGRPHARMDVMAKSAFAVEAAPQFEERSFFEYHLYTLQRPTSVLNNQTKQVSLFPGTSLDTRRIYRYDPQVKNDRASIFVEFDNTKANGLGIALPAGKIRLYQEDTDVSQQFIGEDRIEHTPREEKVRARVGEVFDIAIERIQKDYRQISPTVTETDFEVKIRNHKKETIDLTVVDHFWGDWDIMRSSLTPVKPSAFVVEFAVRAEPDKEVVLTYTVRQK